MEYFAIIAILLVLALLANQLWRAKYRAIGHLKIYSREFTISKACPQYKGEYVQYISVQEDGTSIIKTLFSGEILEAKENRFFKGRDYGLHGLQLISSSYEEQEMLLKHYLPEDIEPE